MRKQYKEPTATTRIVDLRRDVRGSTEHLQIGDKRTALPNEVTINDPDGHPHNITASDNDHLPSEAGWLITSIVFGEPSFDGATIKRSITAEWVRLNVPQEQEMPDFKKYIEPTRKRV